jgi:CBS domain-containing protein
MLDTNVMALRPEGNTTFVCARDDKVIDVWKGMIRHGFMSVPVLGDREKYLGFIDMGEIVGFFANYFGIHTIRKHPTLHQLVDADKAFLKITVEKLMVSPGPPRSAFLPVKNNFSLLYCVEILAKELGIQRIPITNAHGVLWNYLTASHVLEFMRKNLDKMGSIKNKPISQFGDISKPVITIGQDALAYDAFIKMHTQQVHGIAVLDDKQHIVGALSVRDLKLVVEDQMFSHLLETCKTFIQKLGEDLKRPSHTITIKQTDTMQKAIELLVEHKLHRLFVVDGQKHVLGVVGLKELLLEIISE